MRNSARHSAEYLLPTPSHENRSAALRCEGQQLDCGPRVQTQVIELCQEQECCSRQRVVTPWQIGNASNSLR